MSRINEVYMNCKCGLHATAKITPVNDWSFGGYHVDFPKTYEHLTDQEKHTLFENIREELIHGSGFVCNSCGNKINFLNNLGVS